MPDGPVHPEAISVMPGKRDAGDEMRVTSNGISSTNSQPAARSPHLKGEIPLQDIPASVAAASAEPVAKHGVFDAGVIMPPAPSTVEEPVSPEPENVVVPVVPVNRPDAGPPIAKVVPAPTPPPQHVPTRKSAIRTLQSDIAHTVQKNQLSIAQIAMAQKEKDRVAVAGPAETKDVKSFVLGALSAILVLAGIGALGLVLYAVRESFGVPFFDNDNRVVTIIPAGNVQTVDVSTTTRAALLAHIDTFMHDANAEPLDVRAIVFMERVSATSTDTNVASFERFMDVIGTRAPGRLVRTLGPDMMLGTIGNEPFLLVPHDSYDNAFAGMLEWEPFMRDDVPFLTRIPAEPSLFPIASSSAVTLPALPGTTTPPGNDELHTGTSSAATTTAQTSAITSDQLPAPDLQLLSQWKDVVVKNIDARALVREDGETLMLYSFLKDGLLLIATRKETMSVILEILSTPRFGE